MPNEDARHQQSDEKYEVGYGKPPENRQWKKGESGNPGGRRREDGLDGSLNRAMKRRIKVPLDGKQKSLTVRDALYLRATHDALKGSTSALGLLMKLDERREAERRKEIERRKAEEASSGLTIIDCELVLEDAPPNPIRDAIKLLQECVQDGSAPARVAEALDMLISYCKVYYSGWQPGPY
jgi:hypothetical protein